MDRILAYIKNYGIRRTRFRLSIITVAGLYLLYIVYSMVKAFYSEPNGSPVFLYLLSLLFVFVGLFFTVFAGLALYKGWYSGKSMASSEPSDESSEKSHRQ